MVEELSRYHNLAVSGDRFEPAVDENSRKQKSSQAVPPLIELAADSVVNQMEFEEFILPTPSVSDIGDVFDAEHNQHHPVHPNSSSARTVLPDSSSQSLSNDNTHSPVVNNAKPNEIEADSYVLPESGAVPSGVSRRNTGSGSHRKGSSLVSNGIFPEDVSHVILRRLSESGIASDRTLQLFCNPVTSRITKLCLSGCSEVTDKVVEQISSQPLTDIDLSHCESVNGTCLNYLFLCAPTLKNLNLEGCNLKKGLGVNSPEQGVPELSGLINLEMLNIRNTSFQPGYVGEISQLKHLKSLDLSDNVLSSSILNDLTPLCRTLVILKLRNTSLTDCCCFALCHFVNLKELDISDNSNVCGEEFFSHIGNLTELRHLEMSYTRLHNTSFNSLKKRLPQLEFVSVCGHVCYRTGKYSERHCCGGCKY